MKFSELSGTSPAGRPPGLGPEPSGKGVVVNHIPTPSPNWALLGLQPLPIVRNSKNARCSTTCYFNHCILHYILLHYVKFESNIFVKWSTNTTNSEAYPELSQTSNTELLVKVVNGWKPLTIFPKKVHLKCLTVPWIRNLFILYYGHLFEFWYHICRYFSGKFSLVILFAGSWRLRIEAVY